ncbi:MAG: hypothetical protein K6T27_05155, partial [Thermoleophilum sp.]|nr:hypothetical protein [Thermoleophilum sp.]
MYMNLSRWSAQVAVAIAVAHGLLALWYSTVLPLGEGPDEVPHYRYARFLATRAALPIGREADSEGAFQPPLYYALGALLTAGIAEGRLEIENNPDFDLRRPATQGPALIHHAAERWPYRDGALAWHLLRALSAVCGALTVYGIYRLGRALFPKEPGPALGAAAFAAFLPG